MYLGLDFNIVISDYGALVLAKQLCLFFFLMQANSHYFAIIEQVYLKPCFLVIEFGFMTVFSEGFGMLTSCGFVCIAINCDP